MDKAFDTATLSRKLEAAGMERAQVEAVASAICHCDFAAKAEREASNARMERRLMVCGLVLAAVLFAAIKYL